VHKELGARCSSSNLCGSIREIFSLANTRRQSPKGYGGKHVAVWNKRVTGYEGSVKEVYEMAKKNYPEFERTLTFIPREEGLIPLKKSVKEIFHEAPDEFNGNELTIRKMSKTFFSLTRICKSDLFL